MDEIDRLDIAEAKLEILHSIYDITDIELLNKIALMLISPEQCNHEFKMNFIRSHQTQISRCLKCNHEFIDDEK